MASSAGSRSKASIPPASMSAISAERLDRGAQRDDPVRVAQDPDEPAGGVGFDDVAAVDALLDAVAQEPHQDRGTVRVLPFLRAPFRGVRVDRAARSVATAGTVCVRGLQVRARTLGGRGYRADC